MANTQTGGASAGILPTFETQAVASTGNSNYSVPDSNAGAIAAGGFDKIAKAANEWGEAAAKDEATTAGKVAGLDPEAARAAAGTWSPTIRGQAFRAAAMSTYGNQLEAKVRTTTGQIYQDWQALPADQRDPALLVKNLDTAKKAMLDPEKGDVFPQVQPHFEQAWNTYGQSYAKAATADFDKRTLDQASAAAIQNQNATAQKALQLATIPGQDPKVIDAEVASFNKLVDDRVNADQISAVQAERIKAGHLQQVNITKALTNFSGLNDADKAAALAKFRGDYGAQAGGAPPPLQAAAGRSPDLDHVDPRLREIMSAAQTQLPGGYKVVVNEGFNESGHAPGSQHKVAGAGALDLQIIGPDGKPIPNSGADTTGMYTQLARAAYGEMLARHPELKGKLAWGGAFETSQGSGRADLMHFDIGGERGDPTRFASALGGGKPLPNLATGLDNSSFDWLHGQMQKQVTAIQSQADTAQRGALQEISGAQKQIVGGYDVTPSAWAAMQSKYEASPDPTVAGAFQHASRVRGMLAGFQGQPVAAVETQVANMQAALAHGAAPEQVEIAKAAEGYLGRLRSDLASNPVGRYARDFGASVAPINTSSPSALAASLETRAPLAEQAAKQYGLPAPTYLQPDERAFFKSLSAEGGPRMVQTASAMMQSLGARGDAVLKEIEGDAPKFATAARVAAWNGDPGFLNDFAERQRLASDPTMAKALELPSRAAADNVLKEAFGQALSAIPGMNAASRSAAVQVYELRALRDGWDKNLSASDARAALAKTAQQAAGATYQGDVQYGGVGPAKPGWWGNDRALAPLNLRADRIRDAVNAVTDADLRSLPGAPVYADGKTAVPARVIQGGHLVSVGHGMYQVALGDPLGPTPNFVGDATGGRFVLDLNRLAPQLRQRMPEGSWK